MLQHLLLQEEEDASEFVSGLASDLFFYAPHDVLAGQYLFEDWDPALVGLLLTQFDRTCFASYRDCTCLQGGAAVD